ncbi:MAG TPA: hypothetical protein VN176_11865 [Verrucomicrobiae bacterium]|jgi:hypothetical protein|nr:hypothetical protein [Verrucomicrobiae bacterium]
MADIVQGPKQGVTGCKQMSDATQVLTCIADNLTDGGFKVSRNVLLSDGLQADVAASRSCLSWKGLVVLSQHVIVRYVSHATQHHLKALFESGFRFGKKSNWIPLLRGMQFGYMIIPVILTDNADQVLMENAVEKPPRHWALSEFPVVIDLASRRTAYFQGDAAWGAFYFSDLRGIVKAFTAGIPPHRDSQHSPAAS